MRILRQYFLILAVHLAHQSGTDAAAVTRGPYLQSAGSDRMTVCWRTDVATTSELSFGVSSGALSSPVTDPGTRTDHAITLTGLQSSTLYYYRITGTPATGAAIDVGGANYWFRTSPAIAARAPARIWVIGDSGYQFGYAEIAFANYMSANAASGKRTDLFLMLGDNAYAYGTDSEYQGALFNRYTSLLRNSPMWSTVGNHDDTTVPAVPPAPYYSIYHFPTAGECGGVASGTESYYSFNYGNIHFISIDSNTAANNSDHPGAPYGMVDWLLDDLRACSSDWIIAFMHQGPYTKGSHNSDSEPELVYTRAYVVPLLESYGADLILCGHSHSYERSRLINGHYGSSSSWNAATMIKGSGNGSDLGGVTPAGNFVTTTGAANGAYQKPAAIANSGTVYAVVGTSSSSQGWNDGSSGLVNPHPHPAHIVSLTTIGSMVIEVSGLKLNAQFLDQSGAVRDDFTIRKGSTFRVLAPSPAFTAQGDPGISFGVKREGAVSFADQVGFLTTPVSGPAMTPGQGSIPFATGATEASVTLLPVSGQAGSNFNFQLQGGTRQVQPGAAPRSIHQVIAPVSRNGVIESTPANTWYASRFGAPPSSQGVWSEDADGDGLSLLMEYATGGEPDEPDAIPPGKVEGNSWLFRYWRASGRSDVNLTPMISGGLSQWLPAGAMDTADGPASLRGEPRKVTLPLPSPSGFVRLKASFQP